MLEEAECRRRGVRRAPSTRLAEALRHDIMTGTLRPGQRVDLDEWGARMGASRTPVRQALERLEAEGFVKLSGRRGASIIEVTLNHVEDVLATRLVLDAALGRAGVVNLDQPRLDELRDLLAEIEQISLPEEHALMVRPAFAFHNCLFEAADAPMMLRHATQAVHHTNVFLSSLWFSDRRIGHVGKAHYRELFAACQAKDADRVEQLIREYRVDMAGVILRDRVHTDELRILRGVLTRAEFARLRAVVDEGQDPYGPSERLTTPGLARTTSTAVVGIG